MNRAFLRNMVAGLVLAAGLMAFVGDSWSARESNVRATKHNLSKNWGGGGADPRTVKATTETQVCVFCHTPHASTPAVTPLWNKKLSGATYTTYTSSSLDAQAIEGTLSQPGGSSKLCLSCHDGTLAIGNVNVLNGAGSVTTQGTQAIAMSGTGGGGVMAPGQGTTTGFTRFLGTDLSNDHPISVTYNKLLSDRDGEIRDATLNPVDGTWEWVNNSTRIIGVRAHRTQGGSGQQQKPVLPLERTGSASDAGQIQCASCHDPHIRETNEATVGNQKFLRLNRFQENTPGNAYDQAGDIICLACHNKNRGSGAWAYSAHANPLVATPTYTAAAATLREFPANMPVWKAACLNCHDTHAVPGTRRLLREGTDGVGSPKSGGNSAIEETCYQCHTTSANSAITPTTTVPDIKTDFTTLNVRMPIASTNQAAGSEKHDIGGNFSDIVDCTTTTNKCGKDFIEARANLGVGNLTNRHAECTDCHNPHRVVKFKDFRGLNASGTLAGTPDASGTHKHTDDANTTHSNVASGVLRGTWGVEPVYTSNSFHDLPSNYIVKRGDPGANTDTSAAASYVTREYQICLKCHSDYGYSDNNTYPTGNRPNLGNNSGGTASGTNGLTQFTNQAKEFQAPATHKGEVTAGTDGGAGASWNSNNHRSWHPVMDSTGRTAAIRNANASNWNYPWRNAVGTQTMYCTDCHGSGIASSTYSVIPTGGENGSPWGPHGSNNNFLLKGTWNSSTGSGQQADGLCFKCHSYTLYATRGGGSSGFGGSKDSNLHSYHADKIGKMRCGWCHIAVPHGWKNKALLVNLKDVGPEVGLAAGTAKSSPYNQQPYYMNAMLGGFGSVTFKTSGSWGESDCGGRDPMRNNCGNPP